MIDFIRQNHAVIPFAIAAICNAWVGIATLCERKSPALAMAFFSWSAASVFMFVHYCNLPADQ